MGTGERPAVVGQDDHRAPAHARRRVDEAAAGIDAGSGIDAVHPAPAAAPSQRATDPPLARIAGPSLVGWIHAGGRAA